MESPVSPAGNSFEPAPKKSNTGLIIGIVVAVLLCCCCVIAVGVGAYYYTTRAVSDVYSSINEQLLTPVVPDVDIPAVPTLEALATSMPDIPAIPSDAVPQGGLGDDILRADAWMYVNLAAVGVGCTAPSAKGTTIEVTQQPDATTGLWQEKWTVDCGGGDKKAFDITFTPSSKGGTDISVSAEK